MTQEASGKADVTFVALSFAVGPLIGRYCGTKMPSDIRSTTGVLSLTFHTDLAVAKDGFSAQYYLIQEEVPESKLETCAYHLHSLDISFSQVFHLAHARVRQTGVCPGSGPPPVMQTGVTLGVFTVSHRRETSVRITLSNLSLTFHLLLKSSQYLLE